ncbi:hypothetical protein BDP27DRAFT_1384485 [Rhodocollybia butyracea]|uniref:Uncharacterized protein n=1 Tax=Rhodocollybia butyracea TaxID=206335 RepID=A0A9P5PPB0_9AGAR|nr:hypothetical protein BDP27DRAFT_1384485 [Rhodocollybia butyracea]
MREVNVNTSVAIVAASRLVALMLCTILPSAVAFTSLVSAAGVPTMSPRGLIALLQYTRTLDHFQSSHFLLGHFAKRFYVCTFLFSGLIFAISALCIIYVMILPFFFPVDAESFNFASVTFGAVAIFGKWLRREHVLQALQSADKE